MKNEQLTMNNEKRTTVNGREAYFFAFFFFISSFLIFTSCQDPLSLDNTANIPEGKGSFSLRLSAGRTIQPATPGLSDFAVFNLAFTPTDGGDVVSTDRTNENLTEQINLDPGTYNLAVNAYRDSGKTQLMARGTLDNIIITAGQNTPANVTLEALLAEGTGTFRWDITVPNDVTTATMKIAPANTGGTTEETVTLSTNSYTGNRTLNSGQYNLTINLESPGGTVVWKELLYVYQNLESVLDFEFIEDHFINPNYTVTFDSNEGTNVGDQSVLHGNTVPEPDVAPTKVGYAFAGWYTDNTTFANDWDFDDPVIGDITLYAKWEGPVSIEVTKQPNKTTYGTGDTLDISGIEVTATYSNGSTAPIVVTEADITGFDSSTAGDKNLIVTYGALTAPFIITVMDVTLITISNQPDKIVYKIGETLDLTGLIVTAIYGSTTGTATITAANITGFDTNTVGSQILTITYGGKTAMFTVTVIALTNIEVTQMPEKTTYKIGELFDTTGMVVTATYSDGSTETVPNTAVNIAGFDSTTVGQKILFAVYGGQTAQFTVYIVELSSIAITRQPDKTIYIIGQQLDITGIEVTGTYSDNITTGIVAVTAEDISGFDSETTGYQTLTITYGGKTVTFGIQVIASNTFQVADTSQWNTALNRIRAGGNNQTYTIVVSGDVEVMGNTSDSFGTATGITVTLTGSGRLYLNIHINGNLIRLAANQTLIIDSENLTLQGRKSGQNGATQNNNTSLVYVDGTGAQLELRNGTISGNTYNNIDGSCTGGGVLVNSGNFIMSGGEISSNTASGNNYCYGGGVYINTNGTFTMNNGKISGNTVSGSSSSGGGVYVNNGIFTMYDGAISNNTATAFGGGVYVNGYGMRGTFTINGGEISSNTTNIGGGGVYVGENGTFTMNNGEISGNTTNTHDGGGVFVGSSFTYGDSGGRISFSGTFTMNNGVISGNTASGNGGGVWVTGYGIFRIVTGTVYGSGEGDLSNTANNGAAMYVFTDSYSGGTAQYGLFGGPWTNIPVTSNARDITFTVVNGVLQE